MKADREVLRRLATQANELFVVPVEPRELLAEVEGALPTCPPRLAPTVEAFCTNIRSVVSTTGLPYAFALSASHGVRYKGLLCAAELRAVLDGHDSDSRKHVADSSARAMMRALEMSEEGRNALNFDTCRFLLDLANSEEIREGAVQLVLQGLVLTWTAFEQLCRGIFQEYMNSNPAAHTRLLADSGTRKRFELNRLSVERIAEVGFDLSNKLGDLLVEHNDLADLAGIKDTYSALFPNTNELRLALSDQRLWLLYQRRCLIVHRRGVVDRRYCEASGDSAPLGSRLTIRPNELDQDLVAVVRAASALVSTIAVDAGDSGR